MWRNFDFTIYWIGQTISALGNAVSYFVLPLMVLQLTKSPSQVTIVMGLALLPYAIIGLPVGALIDTLDRKRVMKVCDAARCVVLMSVPVANALHVLTIWQLYFVSLITGTCLVFFSVAEVSSLPSIIDRQLIGQANSLIYAGSNATDILGPLAAGVLYSRIGYANLIGFDSISFLISFLSLTLINKEFQSGEAAKVTWKQVKRDTASGLKYLMTSPLIRTMAIIVSVSNFVASPYYVYVLVFARRSLHASPTVLGALWGISSFGAFLGSLTSGKLGKRFGFRLVIVFAILADTLARLVLPLSPTTFVMIPVLALTNAAQAVLNVSIISERQTSAPSQMLGRVNSAFRTLTIGVQPFGLFVGGVIIANTGGFLALLLVGILFVPISFYAWWGLRRPAMQ
ncbi:MFS transporter [Sulfobacillus harzensis]|uniref:MFS transporter n=1 Tax=Sulfobacillus harzensis TaxID=2729629 RepID=UPI003084069E